MRGGLSLMVGTLPFLAASLGNSCSRTLRARAFATIFSCRRRASLSLIVGSTFSTSMLAYQTSRAGIWLYSAMRWRYDRTQASTASWAEALLKPLLRQARTKLAARRLTSHSHGAGSV